MAAAELVAKAETFLLSTDTPLRDAFLQRFPDPAAAAEPHCRLVTDGDDREWYFRERPHRR